MFACKISTVDQPAGSALGKPRCSFSFPRSPVALPLCLLDCNFALYGQSTADGHSIFSQKPEPEERRPCTSEKRSRSGQMMKAVNIGQCYFGQEIGFAGRTFSVPGQRRCRQPFLELIYSFWWRFSCQNSERKFNF